MAITIPLATERRISVDGLSLYTRRRPGRAQPPLLLLHGIGGSLTSWAPLLSPLSDRDVVMIDAPGMGRSAVPARPLRLWEIADYIAGAIETLGLDRVDVLGYSLGGMVAQELARRHPALIGKLALVATMMGIGSRQPPSLKIHRVLMSTRRYRDPECAVRDLPLLAGGRTARDPETLASLIATRALHPPSELGYRYQQWAVIGWSSRRWLRDLQMPTLVLHGDDDPVVHVVNGQLIAERIPDATLEVLADAGHMLLFDEPDKAAEILERFLDH
jgi:pimeloyl-ACP methyl ester carboxylesterase